MIIDGKEIALQIRAKIKEEVTELRSKPGLAVVLVGENPASKVYVNMKGIACDDVGFYSERHNLPETVSEFELINLIRKLNENEAIHGILVQLPLPEHINETEIINSIDPKKDVDGFHIENVGKFHTNQTTLVPCTPLGVVELLKQKNIEISGKNVVVIGRSNIVGKPAAMLLLNEGATVTVCHSKTKNLSEHTLLADIIVVAVGFPKLLKKDMVKEGVVVIDVGVNKVDGKLCGDCDFENLKDKVSYITPVPGGVGPMTIAMLLKNTLKCYKGLN